MRHTISILVEQVRRLARITRDDFRPRVQHRLLNVAPTQDESLSRLTIVLKAAT